MERAEVILSKGDGLHNTQILTDRIRAVCCIKTLTGSGSGFYVKLSLEVSEDMYGILTCNHVLGSESEAKNAYALFNYEGANAGEKVTLRPEVYFRTHTVQGLDYTFVAINKDDIEKLQCAVLHKIVPIALEPETNLSKGNLISIFQHPKGRAKEWSQERILKVEKPFVHYYADTEPGSSGSPVLTSPGMKLVAIHGTGIEGKYNKGTLCSEVLVHLKSGTFTQPSGGASKSEIREDEQPADQVLSALSRDITTFWQDLGGELKVPQRKIDEIVMNNVQYPQPNQKGYQMLLVWKRRGESVTLNELGRALKELGRGDLAVKFCG